VVVVREVYKVCVFVCLCVCVCVYIYIYICVCVCVCVCSRWKTNTAERLLVSFCIYSAEIKIPK